MARAYKLYTEAERLHVLTTASPEHLSATDVLERFGVKPITYNSWRKENGLKGLRGRRFAVDTNGTCSYSTDVVGACAQGDEH